MPSWRIFTSRGLHYFCWSMRLLAMTGKPFTSMRLPTTIGFWAMAMGAYCGWTNKPKPIFFGLLVSYQIPNCASIKFWIGSAIKFASRLNSARIKSPIAPASNSKLAPPSNSLGDQIHARIKSPIAPASNSELAPPSNSRSDQFLQGPWLQFLVNSKFLIFSLLLNFEQK